MNQKPIYTFVYKTNEPISRELIVKFTINGRYYYATMWQPEEWPEPDIISVTEPGSETDVWENLSEAEQDRLNDFIYDTNQYRENV